MAEGGGKAAVFMVAVRKTNVRDPSKVKLLFTYSLCTLLNTLGLHSCRVQGSKKLK